MRRICGIRVLVLGSALCVCLLLPARAEEIGYPAEDLFPLPPSLENAVRFWVRVYGVYECNQYVFHDIENLAVVYEVVRIESLDPERPDMELVPDQRAFLQERKDFYRRLLEALASPDRDFHRLSAEEKRIFDLFGGSRDRQVYARAAGNVRVQKGQKNRFRKGLERKGRYVEFVQRALRSQGIPLELAALPQVESCYNDKARSSAGAAGIWQFTQPTGRLFLRIDRSIDERLDPIRSSEAAARLLRSHWEELGSWPLAITAYNHGLGGMKKARAALGTSDIGEICARYRGPYFGFASRNFYAEFLAALHVMEHSVEYFGEIRPEPSIVFKEVQLPQPCSFPLVAQRLGVPVADLSALNPGLKETMVTGASRLPRGYRLRVPPHLGHPDLVARLSLEAEKRRLGYGLEKKAGDGAAPSPVSAPKNVVKTRESSAREDRGVFGMVAAGEASVPEPERERESGLPVSALSVWRPAEIQIRSNGPPLAGSTRVEPEETPALYAAWLNVPVQKVLKWNRLSRGARLRTGQNLRLVFEKVTPEEFEKARLTYHKKLEEGFLKRYTVASTFPHTLREGESLWTLSESYKDPFWLLKRFNADLDSRPPRSGALIRIPRVESAAGSDRHPST